MVISGLERSLSQHRLKLLRAQNTLDGLQAPRRPKAMRNTPKEEVAFLAKGILEDYGLPMAAKELHKRLVDGGCRIEGRRPDYVLSAMLWRMSETSGITRLSGGGYVVLRKAA